MKMFCLFILIAVAMDKCNGNGCINCGGNYLLVEIDEGKGPRSTDTTKRREIEELARQGVCDIKPCCCDECYPCPYERIAEARELARAKTVEEQKQILPDTAAKSGVEGDGEVDDIISIENSYVAVKGCDEDDFRCKNGLGSVGEVKRCSDFRCPDDRGGMCLREGASGCGTGEECCDGLQCHSKIGICLGKGVTVWETLVKSRGCTECKGSCCDITVTRKVKDAAIETTIKMKPRCADCKGSCCDFFSTMADRVPSKPPMKLQTVPNSAPRVPVQVQMQSRCMDCTRIECCDWGRSENVKQTSMISYL